MNACFMTSTFALASGKGDDIASNTFQFMPITAEFGADNCATQHICGLKELFITMKSPETTIGVRGISGVSIAESIGTVLFTLKYDNGRDHDIKLNNVIFLPGAVKNLISISQWSRDKDDNCAIL